MSENRYTARWLVHKNYLGINKGNIFCSRCRSISSAKTRYCHNCGARMINVK